MKETEIINAKSMGIVCILGGFQLLMSFLDSIGGLMKGSGLEEALGVVLAENTVPHMITRKAISRAVRGHFLVQSALVTNSFKPVIDNGGMRQKALKITYMLKKKRKLLKLWKGKT